jgi:hypothetical protein
MSFGQYFQNHGLNNYKPQKQDQISNNYSAIQKLSNSKKLDSIFAQLYMGGVAIPYVKEYFTYNNAGMVTKIISYENENQVLLRNSKEEFTYDANNRIVERLLFRWDTISNQWVNQVKESTAFTSTSYATTYYHWDNTTSQWGKTTKKESYFNQNSLDTLSLSYNWNSQWELAYKTHYSYNSNNDMTLKLKEVLIGNNWINNSKTDWVYDANFNLTKKGEYTWDAQNNVFVYDYIIRMGYDSQNNKIYDASASYNYSTSSWEKSDSAYYTYAANANLDSSYEYSWDGVSGTWELDSKYEMTYDNNYALSNLVLPLTMFDDDDMMYFNHMFTHMKGYNNNSGQWSLGFTYDLYYSDFIPNSIEQAEQNTISIVPNPAQDYFVVNMESKQLINITIYDANGRLVKTKKESSACKIDIKDFKSGIYFIQITDANKQVFSSKLIKR